LLNSRVLIASSLSLLSHIHLFKGNFNRALEFCKKSFAFNEISDVSKCVSLLALGDIYIEKGELDKAQKYLMQGIKLTGEIGFRPTLLALLARIGSVYRMKGDYKQALKYLKQSITLSEKEINKFSRTISLFDLFLIYLESNSSEKAKQTLGLLKGIADQTESRLHTQVYLLAKALLLKTKSRSRYRAEAEKILKEIIEGEILFPQIYMLSLVSLCDFLFEELYEYNEPEILDELEPLISRLLSIAEEQNSNLHLSEGKLLQAKLALIQMDIDNAKVFLTQAQRIAEMHGLNLLAHKISSEHDVLLARINEWENMKKNDAPMAERIKLASINGVLDRLQGKRAIESPELIKEQPTLLLIIGEGGVLLFSYPFTDEWKRDDELFSSFLSAFTSFSSEFFVKGLDRAKFGDDLILMQSIGPFSICYLFRGQTYTATQRLAQFSERIQTATSIWQTLENFYETSQVLELKDNPKLESLITDIFIDKSE
jgi:hypothetical protein